MFLFFVIGFASSCSQKIKLDVQKPGTQLNYSFKSDLNLNYLLYLPKDYSAERKQGFPTILFLHGSGERGDSIDLVKSWGPPKIAEETGLPFIVISPQCPIDEYWTSMLYPLKGLIDNAIETYNIDTNQIYLTGLSMGGYGTFAFSQMYPEYFAAIAPICGGGTPSLTKYSKAIPTWVFHGEIDPVVPLQSSQLMVDALKEANTEVKFTIIEGVGHDSWIKAYNETNLFDWFLEHKKNVN